MATYLKIIQQSGHTGNRILLRAKRCKAMPDCPNCVILQPLAAARGLTNEAKHDPSPHFSSSGVAQSGKEQGLGLDRNLDNIERGEDT